MSNFRSIAVFSAAAMMFTTANLMAAPGLAEAGLKLSSVQHLADTIASDAPDLTADTGTATHEASLSIAQSLAELVSQYATTETTDSEHECLAGAVYFESKGESLEGQHAVAEVIINRARSGRFPASLCSVVYQPKQFSFVRGKTMPSIPRASAAWRQAATIARIAMEDRWKNVVPKALYFHARHVSPGWKMSRVATVGNHVFYR